MVGLYTGANARDFGMILRWEGANRTCIGAGSFGRLGGINICHYCTLPLLHVATTLFKLGSRRVAALPTQW